MSISKDNGSVHLILPLGQIAIPKIKAPAAIGSKLIQSEDNHNYFIGCKWFNDFRN